MQGIKWETVLTCSPHGYNNERRGEGRRIRRNEGKLVARTRKNDAHVANSLRVYHPSVPAEFIKGRAKTNGLQRVIVVRLWTRQYDSRRCAATKHVAWRGLAWAGHLRATIKASWEQISAPLVELILKRAAGIGGEGVDRRCYNAESSIPSFSLLELSYELKGRSPRFAADYSDFTNKLCIL